MRVCVPLFRRVFAFTAVVAAIGVAVEAEGREPAAGGVARKQVRTLVDVAWSGVPLRQAVTGLLRGQNVGVLVDHRVDPEGPIDLELRGASLDEVIEQIARRSGMGTCRIGATIYMGPPGVASKLAAVAALRRDEVRRLPEAARKRLFPASSLSWKDFATPRELLGEWARAAGFDISNAEIVPHDLWAAADLPAMPRVDQLTLLAAQFDLTFQMAPDGARVRLVPIPDEVALPQSGPDSGNLARPSDRRGATRPPPSDGDLARQRFTITVKDQPLDQTLEQLAARLELQLEIDQEALGRSGVSLGRRVSFGVREVSLDELLRAALEPAGLGFTRQGRVVVIRPAD